MRFETLTLAFALIALAAIPPFLERYHQNVLTYVMLFAYLGVAWNILGGLTGLGSFGHSMFFGIGAYTSAILYTGFKITPWLGMWVGAAFSTTMAALVGYLCFRFGIKGHFFFLTTIAFAEILRNVVMNLEQLGGARGLPLQLTSTDSFLDFQFHSFKLTYYYIAFSMLVLGALMFWAVKHSLLGLKLLCIKDDEEKAAILGINTLKLKMIAFLMSAVLTSLGGSFYAHYVLYVEPTVVFGVPLSVQMALICVVGGLGTTFGPILGGFIVQSIIEYTRIYLGRFSGLDFLIAGAMLVVIALLKPTGLAYIVDQLRVKTLTSQRQYSPSFEQTPP